MSNHQYPNNGPERPRSEPEILPPERNHRAPGEAEGVWIRIDHREGMQRVYIARPSVAGVILSLLIFCIIAAVIFLVLAGLVVLWIPIAIGGIALALLSSRVRHYWQRLRNWLARR